MNRSKIMGDKEHQYDGKDRADHESADHPWDHGKAIDQRHSTCLLYTSDAADE